MASNGRLRYELKHRTLIYLAQAMLQAPWNTTPEWHDVARIFNHVFRTDLARHNVEHRDGVYFRDQYYYRFAAGRTKDWRTICKSNQPPEEVQRRVNLRQQIVNAAQHLGIHIPPPNASTNALFTVQMPTQLPTQPSMQRPTQQPTQPHPTNMQMLPPNANPSVPKSSILPPISGNIMNSSSNRACGQTPASIAADEAVARALQEEDSRRRPTREAIESDDNDDDDGLNDSEQTEMPDRAPKKAEAKKRKSIGKKEGKERRNRVHQDLMEDDETIARREEAEQGGLSRRSKRKLSTSNVEEDEEDSMKKNTQRKEKRMLSTNNDSSAMDERLAYKLQDEKKTFSTRSRAKGWKGYALVEVEESPDEDEALPAKRRKRTRNDVTVHDEAIARQLQAEEERKVGRRGGRKYYGENSDEEDDEDKVADEEGRSERSLNTRAGAQNTDFVFKAPYQLLPRGKPTKDQLAQPTKWVRSKAYEERNAGLPSRKAASVVQPDREQDVDALTTSETRLPGDVDASTISAIRLPGEATEFSGPKFNPLPFIHRNHPSTNWIDDIPHFTTPDRAFNESLPAGLRPEGSIDTRTGKIMRGSLIEKRGGKVIRGIVDGEERDVVVCSIDECGLCNPNMNNSTALPLKRKPGYLVHACCVVKDVGGAVGRFVQRLPPKVAREDQFPKDMQRATVVFEDEVERSVWTCVFSRCGICQQAAADGAFE